MLVKVFVDFSGIVTVDVPDDLNPDDRRLLAEKVAHASVNAVLTKSPDELANAREEFSRDREEQDRDANTDFDKADACDVEGDWSLSEFQPDTAGE